LRAVAAQIVVFGATGYTGRLVADALVERGARPVLAARNRSALDRMAAELGGLDTAVADVAQPESVHALVERGDVLVSTVGPFLRFGRPALDAAVEKGALYLDSTGEPPFIRRSSRSAAPRRARARRRSSRPSDTTSYRGTSRPPSPWIERARPRPRWQSAISSPEEARCGEP
jgi:short subunit dehydrogenase-like uncharacterized protein